MNYDKICAATGLLTQYWQALDAYSVQPVNSSPSDGAWHERYWIKRFVGGGESPWYAIGNFRNQHEVFYGLFLFENLRDAELCRNCVYSLSFCNENWLSDVVIRSIMGKRNGINGDLVNIALARLLEVSQFRTTYV